MRIIEMILNFLKNLFKVKSKNLGGKIHPTPEKKEKPQVIEKPFAPKPPPVSDPVIPEKIVFEIPDITLYLGHHDDDVAEATISELTKIYHTRLSSVPDSIRHKKFRNSDLFDWVELKPVEGGVVKKLQVFLKDAGFLPPISTIDGVFGYATQAGVRLFQEYVRTIEKIDSIGIPDGVVGNNVWNHIKRWAENRKTADKWTRSGTSKEFDKWLSMLREAKKEYQSNPHKILELSNKKVEQLKSKGIPTDTLKVEDWNIDPEEIHLIGIRRREEDSKGLRKNDDVFVLLINGMVFKFWGSTDPNHGKKVRADEAFLVEGQHKFRFGWHNVSASRNQKSYQGLNPYDRGVLVFRDWDHDNKLTDADIEGRGIDNSPNTTINIHWTGEGRGPSGTWSEGCQVIAGGNYINNLGEKVECSTFAAAGSKDLLNNKSEVNIAKTKGAYNVFTDLILLYAPKRVDYLYYSLGRDETLSAEFISGLAGEEILAGTVKAFDLPGDEAFA